MPTQFPFQFPATIGDRPVAPAPLPDRSIPAPTPDAVPPLQFSQWLAGIFPSVIGEGGLPDLLSEPESVYRYLNGRRQTIQDSAKQRPLLRLADKDMNLIGDIEGEQRFSVEELYSDSGKCTGAIRYGNWLTDYMVHETRVHEDLHILVDPNPTDQTWRTRWGGKITGINAKKDANGIHTVEFEAISNREHAKHLMFGANPIFPPEVQLPKMWVLPGPTRSILYVSMMINLARLFMPGLSTFTNGLNPFGWFDPLSPDSLLNFDPFHWPLQAAFVNPVWDQSRWEVLGSTWTDWHTAMQDILLDASVVFRAYTYLTTDADSPHQELIDMLRKGKHRHPNLEQLATPDRNCVVFGLENRSDQRGPTGTSFDGLLNLIGVTLDDLITPVTVNLKTGKTIDPGNVLNGEPIESAAGDDRTHIFEKLLGVAPAPPRCIWWEGDYNGQIEAGITLHKGPVKTVMTGGRSPAIVNQAQTFAIRYALSQLSAVINYVVGAYQQPGTPGLDNLYQGQLDNTLFAWQRFTDPVRAIWSGAFAWQEDMERGSGTAYTLSGIMTIRAGNWKRRAYTGFKCTVLNARPHVVDVDIRLGEMGGFEFDHVIYVDQLTAIKREWDRDKPVTVSLSIGDDRDKEDPFARGMRAVAAMWSLLGQFLGEGTIFG
jgi:hypothetical protein